MTQRVTGALVLVATFPCHVILRVRVMKLVVPDDTEGTATCSHDIIHTFQRAVMQRLRDMLATNLYLRREVADDSSPRIELSQCFTRICNRALPINVPSSSGGGGGNGAGTHLAEYGA